MSEQRSNGHDHFQTAGLLSIGEYDASQDDNVGVLCVSPQESWQMWPYVAQYFVDGQEAGGEHVDQQATLLDLGRGFLLLWVIHQNSKIVGALITRLVKGNGDLVCHLMTIGGSGMRDWLRLHPVIEAYAKAEGCSRMRVYGRVGWKKVLTDYEQTGVILEKRL